MWKATTLAGIFCLCLVDFLQGAEISVRLDARRTAELTTSHDIVLEVTPHDGDAWTRLAKRVCGDSALWEKLAEMNDRGPNLLRGVPIEVPFDLVRPEMRLEVIRELFPLDARHERGWIHEIVSSSGPEGESLWKIAEWFSGSGENYGAIRDANPGLTLSTKSSQRILIPEEILRDEFRDEPVETREALAAIPQPEQSVLDYGKRETDRHAIYRLREGEAIYSSVAIRFTGRIHADDVNDVIAQIVDYNGIEDVSRLPVGYPVKIPIDLLTPEFRPADDPMRVEWERLQRQREQVARGIEAKRLEGVHVIIDPGHGGRDVGAMAGEMYEAVYVYDIASRLKSILEDRTGATVWITTRSKALGYETPSLDMLEPVTDHVLLTTPNYDLDDPIVGVNLRWYLSNAIYRRVIEKTEPEKVVFLSIHADSLHPSLRGAMAYIPGER
ncbi:MAG: N-acetylmuramoyl-L-alanine amidase, partial [Thermoanaerobaculia bacterium]|nr:N-acetylmuramoyl-L-alanine amidase [Thermoanaerobaculia bacterium]